MLDKQTIKDAIAKLEERKAIWQDWADCNHKYGIATGVDNTLQIMMNNYWNDISKDFTDFSHFDSDYEFTFNVELIVKDGEMVGEGYTVKPHLETYDLLGTIFVGSCEGWLKDNNDNKVSLKDKPTDEDAEDELNENFNDYYDSEVVKDTILFTEYNKENNTDYDDIDDIYTSDILSFLKKHYTKQYEEMKHKAFLNLCEQYATYNYDLLETFITSDSDKVMFWWDDVYDWESVYSDAETIVTDINKEIKKLKTQLTKMIKQSKQQTA